MKRFANFYPFVITIGVLIWVLALPLVGATVSIAGFILWLGALIGESRPYANDKPRTSPKKATEDEPTHLNYEDEPAYLNIGYGDFNDTVEVYRSRQIYERTVENGPPVTQEVWEYFIKDDRVVFERLRDRSNTSWGPPEYEVVNNAVLERVYKQKQREWEESRTRSGAKDDYWEKYPLYSDEKLAEIRQELLWDEVHGVLKYFILHCHFPHGKWWKDVRKLKNSFSELEAEAQKLGALPTDYGAYKLPDDASVEQKKKFAYLFSQGNLRTYHNTTFSEFVTRAKVLQFLEENDPKTNKAEPSSRARTE